MRPPSIISTRAVLLRAHDYSETSRVMRYFTEDHGIVGVMARGIRKRSAKGGASAGLFEEVMLTLQMKPGRDLQTLREATGLRARPGLGRNPLALAAASVLGEILLRHHGEEGSPSLYVRLGEALDQLAATPMQLVPGALLVQGWGLVTELGFQPELDHCVSCGADLGDGGMDADAAKAHGMGRMDFNAGGMRCGACSEGFAGPRVGPGARRQLHGLLLGRVPEPLDYPNAHLRLFSDFVSVHVVGGRPLEAFRVFAALLPPTVARA